MSWAQRAIRFVLVAIVFGALVGTLLAGPASEASGTSAAVAKKQLITGSLSKRGYTVLALSASSPKASFVRVTGNRFRLRAPSVMPVKLRALRGCVTLQLRAPDGIYAGPVVLGTKRKGLVIVGVNATNGASLGAIKIDSANGYARTKRKPAASSLCSTVVAQANGRGVPIGNGRNVGLVRSTKTGVGQDSDLDGVPNSLDVDDNGNLILDRFDRSTTSFAPRANVSQAPGSNAFMNPTTTFSGAVDVNAYGSSDQDVREAERTRLSLAFNGGGFDPGTPVELDCGGHPDPNNPNGWIGGLSYCTPGGTGRLLQGTPGNTPGFPTPCCDANGNGLAELRQIGPMTNPVPGFFGMPISPGATPDQIHPGDVMITKGTSNGAPVDISSTLGLVLATPPALARYDDRQGDSGTLNYPWAQTSQAFPEIRVRANVSGDVVVDLTFWRAQRLRIATEPGSESWMDVGHMSHLAQVGNAGSNGGCPASSYSNVDPKLSLQPPNEQLITPYLKDLGGDKPTDRAKPFDNSFSYTLNLTNCLASYGISFNVGETRNVSFLGVSQPINGTFANASSIVSFSRVG